VWRLHNNNKVILIKIITDGNLTLTKRLIKKYCTSIISVKKERVGLGGSRMSTKENKISKAGRPCSWECFEKKLKHTVIQKHFFLEILSKIGRQESISRAPRWTGLLYILSYIRLTWGRDRCLVYLVTDLTTMKSVRPVST
jgi:hypothetical protein